jgi:Flp pilus assembly pilin Flp
MEKMWTLIKKFVKEEEGMETVEYAVVAGLVIAVGVAIWGALGARIQVVMTNLLTSIGGTAP